MGSQWKHTAKDPFSGTKEATLGDTSGFLKGSEGKKFEIENVYQDKMNQSLVGFNQKNQQNSNRSGKGNEKIYQILKEQQESLSSSVTRNA
mmetsp:Transcript_30804/g.30322  ORF Transcript_30804/g.30322 Transcript_30804/m.30322 type:complete len:91 (+) Transcript_30804:1160-1432(+)|eukprot:CAMPEP_0170544318 /NCGR_PEP_ID=MMETSP0211-20121228/3122_1 /TAXON_ID=311385 /ORGANISM="Pseudokeronopsis sp., Strain OXSARD2" /LENGTH=90 /DNA_ID=CAMNT_0010847937 /DNA_START=1661 /DNA_END=1933 /DNA_ORIENTATION=-